MVPKVENVVVLTDFSIRGDNVIGYAFAIAGSFAMNSWRYVGSSGGGSVGFCEAREGMRKTT
jgi:hypothetical protein